MNSNSKLEAALELASRGFHVFPVVANSKLPLIDGWQRRATTDPDTIRRWWTCPVMGTEQDHNVGICTSRFNGADHLVVLDVDNKEGRDGMATLGAVTADHPLPATLHQKTPSGGQHFIFRTAKPLRKMKC